MLGGDLDDRAIRLLHEHLDLGGKVSPEEGVETGRGHGVSGRDERVVGVVNEGEGEHSLLGEVRAVDASEGAAAKPRVSLRIPPCEN